MKILVMTAVLAWLSAPLAASEPAHGVELHASAAQAHKAEPSAPARKEAANALAHHPAGPGISADEALARLLDGNRRFLKGEAAHPNAGAGRRAELAAGQAPFAAVLTCSDSRVPPELLFDQGLGDIFTVRVAGNIAGSSEQGSIEYAAEHLATPVIMVLGHTSCGAVKATAAGGHVEGHLASVVKGIEPAVKAVKARGARGPELAAEAVEENVRLNALALLRKNPVVRKLAADGKVKVVPAVYDISTGEVRLLDLEPSLKAERKAKVAAVKGLLSKFRTGYLEDAEKAGLLSALADLLPELN